MIKVLEVVNEVYFDGKNDLECRVEVYDEKGELAGKIESYWVGEEQKKMLDHFWSLIDDKIIPYYVAESLLQSIENYASEERSSAYIDGKNCQ